jgi:hypothetical protein
MTRTAVSLAHDLAQRVGVPPAVAQDRLLTPGARIARRLGAHPARLSRFVANKSLQKLPSRYANPPLTEQGTYPSKPDICLLGTGAEAVREGWLAPPLARTNGAGRFNRAVARDENGNPRWTYHRAKR